MLKNVTVPNIPNLRVELRKITPFDVIIILIILMISAGVILWSQFGVSGALSDNAAANVYHDGKFSQRISLDLNQELVLLDGKMVLEVRDKRIRVLRSDCPRQLCVQQGWASHGGDAIVCVPFKTLIEIESKQKSSVDAVVY